MNHTHSTRHNGSNGAGNSGEHAALKGLPLSRHGYVLITGGAGFIGTNLAHRLLSEGYRVMIYDNLSRAGVERNLKWLLAQHGNMLEPVIAGITDEVELRRCVRHASQLFHFAAQVAVTTSLVEPYNDFEINAMGTLKLLEALRGLGRPVPLVFTSTNKVYGGLDDVDVREEGTRYVPADAQVRRQGVSEARPLDFHSPYGCSKGAADQYVRDYARSFGMPTVVFRMSCIYGLHQFGTEDQGWVAHFLIKALEGEPITLYGNGKQVRDILFVDDLVNAFLMAQAGMEQLAGRAFNMGGGPANTTSLLELLSLIGRMTGREPEVRFDHWRVGDQKYYVSDTSAFRQATGWDPRVSVIDGITRLYNWLTETRSPSVTVGAASSANLFAPTTIAPTWVTPEVAP